MRILLFDIDGTLIDSAGSGGNSLLDTLRIHFGIESPNRVPLHGRTDGGILRELLQVNGLEPSAENLERFRSSYFDQLPKSLQVRSGRVLPGVRELLTALRDVPNVTRSLLTGNMERSAWIKLRHYGLAEHFRGGVFGDHHTCRKMLGSDAIGVLNTQFEHPVSPDQVIVIGDTTLDVDCARAIGCSVLAVTTGGFSREQLADHGADWVADDLTDLPTILSYLCG